MNPKHLAVASLAVLVMFSGTIALSQAGGDPLAEVWSDSDLRWAQSAIIDACMKSDHPQEVLYATLAKLEKSGTESEHRRSAAFMSITDEFMHHPCTRRRDDLLKELDRLAKRDIAAGSPLHRLRQLFDQSAATKRNSPYDWERGQRDFWLLMMDTLLRSSMADNPAALWRAQLARDPQEAGLYHVGYLQVVRNTKPAMLDTDLLRAFLELPDQQGKPASFTYLKYNLLLNALDARPNEAAALREHTEKRFFQWLSQRQDRGTFHSVAPLAYKSGSADRRWRIIRTLLAHQEALIVKDFAKAVEIPTSTVQKWLLSRPSNLQKRGKLNDLLESIQQPLGPLRLWVDATALNDAREARLAPAATTLEALEALLAPTPYRVHFISADFTWIGPAEKRPAVEQWLHEAKAKALGTALLLEPSQAEFDQTYAEECLDYLNELHGFPVNIGGFASQDRQVSIPLTIAPAWLIVAEIARQADLDYDVFEGVLVVRPAKELGLLQQRLAAHRRRSVRIEKLRLEGNKIARALSKPDHFDFADASLGELVEHLSERFDVPVRIARVPGGGVIDDVSGTPITIDTGGVSAEVALTLMLSNTELIWDTNGKILAIGRPQVVAALLAAEDASK